MPISVSFPFATTPTSRPPDRDTPSSRNSNSPAVVVVVRDPPIRERLPRARSSADRERQRDLDIIAQGELEIFNQVRRRAGKTPFVGLDKHTYSHSKNYEHGHGRKGQFAVVDVGPHTTPIPTANGLYTGLYQYPFKPFRERIASQRTTKRTLASTNTPTNTKTEWTLKLDLTPPLPLPLSSSSPPTNKMPKKRRSLQAILVHPFVSAHHHQQQSQGAQSPTFSFSSFGGGSNANTNANPTLNLKFPTAPSSPTATRFRSGSTSNVSPSQPLSFGAQQTQGLTVPHGEMGGRIRAYSQGATGKRMSAAAAAAVNALARVSGKHTHVATSSGGPGLGDDASNVVHVPEPGAIDASNASEIDAAPNSPAPPSSLPNPVIPMVSGTVVVSGLGVVVLPHNAGISGASNKVNNAAANAAAPSPDSTPNANINATTARILPARSSPPPSFLIDDDPFADLSGAPAYSMPMASSSTSSSSLPAPSGSALAGSAPLPLTAASVGVQVQRPPRLDPHARAASSGPVGPLPRSPLGEVPEVDSEGERSDGGVDEGRKGRKSRRSSREVVQEAAVVDEEDAGEGVVKDKRERSKEKEKGKKEDKEEKKDKEKKEKEAAKSKDKDKEGGSTSTRLRAKSFFGAMSAPASPSKGFFFSSSSTTSPPRTRVASTSKSPPRSRPGSSQANAPQPPLPTNMPIPPPHALPQHLYPPLASPRLQATASAPTSPNRPSSSGGFAAAAAAATPPTPFATPRVQTRAAHTRPAFSSRPSLPSLDTLARMNIVLTKKVRKGRVGAGLPFEPWDNMPSDDELDTPVRTTSMLNPNSPNPSSTPTATSPSASSPTTTTSEVPCVNVDSLSHSEPPSSEHGEPDAISIRGRDTPTPTPMDPSTAVAAPQPLLPSEIVALGSLASDMEMEMVSRQRPSSRPASPAISEPQSREKSKSRSRSRSREPPTARPMAAEMHVKLVTPMLGTSLTPPPPLPPQDGLSLLAPPTPSRNLLGAGMSLDLRLSGIGDFAIDLDSVGLGPDRSEVLHSEEETDVDGGYLGDFLESYGVGFSPPTSASGHNGRQSSDWAYDHYQPFNGRPEHQQEEEPRSSVDSYAHSTYSDSYSDVSFPSLGLTYPPSLSHGHSDSTTSFSLSLSRSISSRSSIDSLGAIEDEPAEVDATIGRSGGRSAARLSLSQRAHVQEASGDTSHSSGDTHLSLTRSSSESNTSSLLHSPTAEDWGFNVSHSHYPLVRDEPKLRTSAGVVRTDGGDEFGYGYGHERLRADAGESGRLRPLSGSQAHDQAQARVLLPPVPLQRVSYGQQYQDQQEEDQQDSQQQHHSAAADGVQFSAQAELQVSPQLIPTTTTYPVSVSADFDSVDQPSPSPFDIFAHAVPPPTPVYALDDEDEDMLNYLRRPHTQAGGWEPSRRGDGNRGHGQHQPSSSAKMPKSTPVNGGYNYSTSNAFDTIRASRGGRRGSDDEDEEEDRRRRRWLAQVQRGYDDGATRKATSSDDESDDYGEPSAEPLPLTFQQRSRGQSSSSGYGTTSASASRSTSTSASASRTGSVVPSSRVPSSATQHRFPFTSSSASASTTDMEELDDDDVPLAQRIPSALTAQKSIRKQVKEERDAKRAARAERSAKAEADEDRRERQMTLRPAGAGMGLGAAADMSSSHEAALLAAAAANANANSYNALVQKQPPTAQRQRTMTMPSKPSAPPMPAFGINPDDLARKLQSVKVAEGAMASGMVSPMSPSFMQQQQLAMLQYQQQQQAALGRATSTHQRAKRSVDLQRSSTSSKRPSHDFQSMGIPMPPPPADEDNYVPPSNLQALAQRSKSIKVPRSRSPMRPSTTDSVNDTNATQVSALRPMRSFHRPSVDREPMSPTRQTSMKKRSMSVSRGGHEAREEIQELLPPLPANFRKPHNPDSRVASTRTSIDADRGDRDPRRPSVGSVANHTSPAITLVASREPTTTQRIFVGNLQQFHMVEVGASTSAGDVISMIEAQGALVGWAGTGGWMVWEIAQDFGMERPVRSYELLADVQSSWLKEKTVNFFLLRLTPLAIPLARSAIPSSSPTHSGYVEWEVKRGKWSKRWMMLREHSIYLSKRDNGRDETLLCSLSNFDAYRITRTHRAPKPFAFAIKSTDNLSFFENTADYLHSFSCSEKDGEAWMEKILVARSYVLHQERHVLFNPKSSTGTAGAGGGAAVSRSGTRKGPSARPAQPLVPMPPLSQVLPQSNHQDVFEPGSLLSSKQF